MQTVLVVDDSSIALSLAKAMLSDRYNICAVLSGQEAIRFLDKRSCDLILLDINMPELSGFDTLKLIKENPQTADIPIIFLTSDADPETERLCFEMGAYDFIVKPFQKATLRSRVSRTLDLLNLQKSLEDQLLEKTKDIARLSLKSMMLIANTVDKKDPFAANHSTNVAWFAVEIAKRMGWSGDELYNLQNLALIHDIGNVGISDNIIRKKGPLTSAEYETVKQHTTFGKDILRDMTVIKKAAEVAETHHERYDGLGYPNGLAGTDIPVEARIIAVADAFDAMTSDRSFRQHSDPERMLKEFENGRGTQFDPQMADIAIELIKENNIEPGNALFESDSDLAVESSKLLQKVLQEYTREIRSEAQKDTLTGLWNRGYTVEYINDYLEDKRHCGCFFMIDIDCFKQINDNFGHIAGDRAIVRLADNLRSIIRSDDTLCRVGGDEFIIFFKGIASRSFAASKAEEIILLLDKDISENTETNVSVSIGISLAPYDGSDFTSLYNKADKALYHTKNDGKHGYHFFSDPSDTTPAIGKSTQIDFEYLRRFIVEQESGVTGAYHVEYDTFKKIYRFLARAQKRSPKPILMLLLTISERDGSQISAEDLQNALSKLKTAVTTSIRSGDIATNYSASQYIAILVDSTLSNGYFIAERIRKLFYSSMGGMDIKLSYDISETPELSSTKENSDAN